MGVSGAGCVVTIDPIDDGGDGGGDPGSQDGTVTIRVVNNTTTGLDPEIYLADGPVSESELFDDSRKFVEFGVFGLGVIDALSSDSITVTCEQARMVGTKGGTFGETVQDPQGTGTKRVLAQELQFNCGDRITFIYSRAGDGFETTFEVD
ncbi:MAG: hypothetical protein D6744_14145 [Planctomycetota bacterium]|nr:MAG: hypothetical protein D6744_14145 [Planctomycetota bacterium]